MAKATVASKSKNAAGVAALHPPYFEMIKDAISTMDDRTGSSQPAISKFIGHKYSRVLPSNFKKVLSIQLKKFVKSERLLKVKNSFKLSPTEKHRSAKTNHKNQTSAHSDNALARKRDTAKNTSNRGVKTKRLSQVKTPESMKMAAKGTVAKKKTLTVGERIKKLSQIKTPDIFKRTKTNPTARRKRRDLKPKISSKPAKKARK